MRLAMLDLLQIITECELMSFKRGLSKRKLRTRINSSNEK